MKYKVKLFNVFVELFWNHPEIELLDVRELIIWVPDGLSMEGIEGVTKYEKRK